MHALIIPDVKVQILESVRIFTVAEEALVVVLLLVLLVDVNS